MNVAIIGAGICGLGTALLLARDGHDVTVLERDPASIPDSPQSAWDSWTRKGVLQFRQPHNFMPGLRLLLDAEMPDINGALERAGASRFDLVHPLPPTLRDRSPQPIDDKLWTWTARRPVGEWLFATSAENEPRVTVRRGVQIQELITGASAADGIPHVAGVRTTSGEELKADLVVDATGRQSRSTAWLMAMGALPPYEEEADSGFTYYTRYFAGTQPQRRGPGLTPIGSMSLLTLPGDNGVWSVTLFIAAGDQPLKNLRHEDQWTKVVRACPFHAHWLDGEPITDVLPMSGIVDRYRRFVVDDKPVATGFAAVADAWACTNPSAGRGLTVGFLHALVLRDVLREAGSDPYALVEEFDRKTEAEVTPWYRAQIAVDRARFADMAAAREGQPPPQRQDEIARGFAQLTTALAIDSELFRAALEYIGTVTPIQQILERPDVIQRLQAAGEVLKNAPPPPPMGPNRHQLLALMH